MFDTNKHKEFGIFFNSEFPGKFICEKPMTRSLAGHSLALLVLKYWPEYQ